MTHTRVEFTQEELDVIQELIEQEIASQDAWLAAGGEPESDWNNHLQVIRGKLQGKSHLPGQCLLCRVCIPPGNTFCDVCQNLIAHGEESPHKLE